MPDLIPDEERDIALRAVVESARGKMNDTEWAISQTEAHTAYRIFVDAILSAGFRRVSPVTREADALLSTVRSEHVPVEIEPSDTICRKCSLELPNGRFFNTVEWPCVSIELADALSTLSVSPPAEVTRGTAKQPVQVEVTETMIRDALESYLSTEGKVRDAMRAALSAALGGGE